MRLRYLFTSLILSSATLAFAQPANDLCENATAISLGAAQAFSNVDAGLDGPEHPTAPCFSFGDDQVNNDVWYSYTADFDGYLLWSTCDLATFDTRLAVYAANSVCPVVDANLLACNDDGAGCADFTSQLTFQVSNGSTYLLRLGGYANGDMGDGTFDLIETIPPPVPDNDLCENATVVDIVSEADANNDLGWNEGTTAGSFLTGEIPVCAQNGAGEFQDVWYAFNSGGNSNLEIRIESQTDLAEFGIDIFSACGVPVLDINNAGEFYQQCYSQADIDVFLSGIIEIGEMEDDTDYLLRISSQITYYPVGDFRFQLVQTNGIGISENGMGSVRIYPNPSNGVFRVRLDASDVQTAQLLDLSGRIVSQSALNANPEFILDYSSLSAGTYIVQFLDVNSVPVGVERIIIE